MYYMDKKDEFTFKPSGDIGQRDLDKDREDFLRKYIDFIMNGKMVSDTTKIYIRSYKDSVADAFKSYNEYREKGEQINLDTAQSKVNYDRKKLLKYFDDDMLEKVIYADECDIERYEKRLMKAIADYGKKNKILDNIMISLPKVSIQDELSEDEFSDFLKIISPYFKKHKQYIEEHLPKKSVGYLYYLLYTPQLTKEHKERYQLLHEMLGD